MPCDARLDRVMVIDDQRFDQVAHRRVLEKSGLVGDIIVFQYAEEALAHLREDKRPLDVIFLDINMPRMNGFQFLEAAHREFGGAFAQAVVIMLTTSLDAGDRARAAQFAAVKHFISKPLKLEDVEHVAQLVQGLRQSKAG